MTTYTADDFKTELYAKLGNAFAIRIDPEDSRLPWRVLNAPGFSIWRSDASMAAEGWERAGSYELDAIVRCAQDAAPTPAPVTVTDDMARLSAKAYCDISVAPGFWEGLDGEQQASYIETNRKILERVFHPRPDGAEDIEAAVTAAMEASGDPADIADSLAALGYRKPAAPTPF